MNRRLEAIGMIKHEELPGAISTTDDKLREFVRNESWGITHPARTKSAPRTIRWRCSTAASACAAPEGLRVVDASVFPKIPGYFIVSPFSWRVRKRPMS